MVGIWGVFAIVAACAAILPARASALVVDRERTAYASFSGTGCADVVTRRLAITLPRGARRVGASAPEPGDPLLDDYGDEVAEVVSVGALERDGRRVSVTVGVKGLAASCATPNAPDGFSWETEDLSVAFTFRAPVKVYFPHSCCGDRHSYKPSYLLLGASFALDQARWSSWDGPVAKGTARLPYNDCVPYCAAGHVTYYRVSVRLSRPRLCNGHYQYLTLRYRFGRTRPPRAPWSATSNFGFRCEE
jgi:hypothetical protein